MMTHWFDRVARSFSQSTFVGAPSGRQRPSSPPKTKPTVREVLNGPCLMRVSGQNVTQGFSTQTSSADGALFSYDTISTRSVESGTLSSATRISRNAKTLFESQTHASSNGQASIHIRITTRDDEVRQVVVTIAPQSVNAQVDGRSIPLTRESVAGDLAQTLAVLTSAGEKDTVPQGDVGAEWPRWELEPEVLQSLKDLSHRVRRDMPGCGLIPQTLEVMEGHFEFPGCQDCQDRCDKARDSCIAAAFAEAATCGPFYGVCLGGLGARCLSIQADCLKGCSDGGPCCPVHCERGGYGECCPPGLMCCGARCCPSGEICADPAHDLCCAFGSGAPCGTHCCNPGFKCASLSGGVCCPQDAGDYCPDEWGSPRCCPPEQVCADRETGLCCARDHGPVCGDHCCAHGQVCLYGTCCDPKQVCGSGENAVCCNGVCKDGACCGAPSHMCGEVCCPPFNPCCRTIIPSRDGVRLISTCCGAYDVCMEHGCCPRESVCGRVCCPTGEFCADPAKGVCKPCQGDYLPCQMMGHDGQLFSICCPPGVTCCNGQCCKPGQLCAAPNGVAGCYESYQVIH
jgi:hypothetical protein